jgi:UDP-N-acetylglucosamine 3-dehydrogenase
MDPLTVAVVGVGYWGQKHVEELLAAGAKVIAVDPDPAAAARIKQRFGVDTAPALDIILKDPAVAAVTICAPNRQHAPMAKQAILAGKHVFVEKPLALAVKDAQELVDLARARKTTLVVGHLFRFNNAVRAAKHMMDYGEFGRIVLVKLVWANAEPVFPDRDVVFDLGPHSFDILHYLFGKHPDSVGAVGSAVRRPEGAEVAFVHGRIENALYQFELSWLTPRKTRRLEIIGTRKSLIADLNNQKVEVFENGGWHDAGVVPNNTIRAELEAFLAAIANRNQHIAEGEIGVGNLRMLELAMAALGTPGKLLATVA